MAFGRKEIKDDLKKAIYKAIAKAYRQNIPFVKQAVDGAGHQEAVNSIIADLDDPNSIAQVPEEQLPVDKDNVLNKDVPSVGDINSMKEDQAKAKMGLSPNEQAPMESKGVQKLKKFLENRTAKMEKGKDISESTRLSVRNEVDEKGVHLPTRVHSNESEHKGDAKEQSYMGIQNRRGDVEGAKATARGTLEELKGMPSPKLGKASPHEKGVHPSVNSILDKPNPKLEGKSIAGLSGKENEISAHKKVLNEIKQMPKPNLGKSDQKRPSKWKA